MMPTRVSTVLLLTAWLVVVAEGFVATTTTRIAFSSRTVLLHAANNNNNNGSGDRPRRRNRGSDDESSSSLSSDDGEIPQLPSFGETSFDATAALQRKFSDNPEEQMPEVFVMDRKFELQYTCKVCETRNSHKVSRIAYNQGVVITTCKGCKSQHLISDHLGFTQQFDGNLEEMMKEKGTGETVQRVTEEVFNLEKALGLDSKSGSILGPDGTPTME